TALVLQHYDKCSDEEAWERASYDLRWKVAPGTETVERPFAKSTLQLFRAQLLANQKMRVPFERSLELGRRQGLVRASRAAKLALDTSNILGRGAVRDTYKPDLGWDSAGADGAGQGEGSEASGLRSGPGSGAPLRELDQRCEQSRLGR